FRVNYSLLHLFLLGIVLWEITAREVPYGKMHHVKKEVVEKGCTLEKPSFCSDEMYALMKECWSYEPNGKILPRFIFINFFPDRPTFENILVKLNDMPEDNDKNTSYPITNEGKQ